MKVSVFIERPLVCIDTEKLRVYITNGPWQRQGTSYIPDGHIYDTSLPDHIEMFLAVADVYELTEEANEALKMLGIEQKETK